MTTVEIDHKELRSVHYVSELLEMLVGKDMKLSKGEVFQLARDPGYIGTYVREDGELGGIFISDLEFAAFSGCALSLVPKREADTALKDGILPDHIVDNYREIVNVASRLYTTPRTPRVIFEKLILYPTRLEPEVLDYLARPTERVDFSVDIGGYGIGRFALIIQ